ncbi:MAG: hypothetical protein ACM31P_13375 [Actinomycetota bacterium]
MDNWQTLSRAFSVNPSDETNSVEREKLSIERDKLQLEREKLEVERLKAKWTAIGVTVPIVVVAATVMLGIWSQYQKGRDDFALKAAEILMAGENPITTQNKAKALAVLFSSQLPPDFAKSFDPDAFGHSDDTLASKRDLVNLMAAHPTDSEKILAMWKAMFPGDEWLAEFEKNLRSNLSSHRSVSGRR